MGCQTKIAAQIIAQGGDDVLGLKANQETLHEEVREFFTTALAGDFAGVVHDYTEEVDKDYGRLDVRRYWVTEELGTLSDTPRWSALRSIGMVERECWSGDHHTIGQRLFINSIPADAKRFAHAVRGHWGVENRLHWRLDVVFSEDARPHPQGPCTGDHDRHPPPLYEFV
jgi:predicted transposase YbfD/YdcC